MISVVSLKIWSPYLSTYKLIGAMGVHEGSQKGVILEVPRVALGALLAPKSLKISLLILGGVAKS